MPSKKTIAWGCGIAALVCVLAIAAVVYFFAYIVQDVKGVGVAVDGPVDVVVGQVFELNVTVTNERPRKVVALSDIDIAEDYLGGFTVSTIKPKPKSNKREPINNSRSFTFGIEIPPGASRVFSFMLRAEKPGLYRGDVDVYEGVRSITGMAQTNVKEKQ